MLMPTSLPVARRPEDGSIPLMEVRWESLHTVQVRAREVIGHFLTGETKFTEEELDAIVALKDALDAIPQPGLA